MLVRACGPHLDHAIQCVTLLLSDLEHFTLDVEHRRAVAVGAAQRGGSSVDLHGLGDRRRLYEEIKRPIRLLLSEYLIPHLALLTDSLGFALNPAHGV